MQKLFGGFFFVLFLFFFVSNSPAQQWSDAQKEVWTAVDAYWAVGLSDRPMDFLSVFDESYYGWSYENEAPGTKADVKKSFGYWKKNKSKNEQNKIPY